MARITFKTKIKHGTSQDYIDVPLITSKHCDMNEFRKHPKFANIANSVLFEHALRKHLIEIGASSIIWLSRIPNGVTVIPGFLATVIIEV